LRISAVDVSAEGDSSVVSFIATDIEVRYAFVCNYSLQGDVIVEIK
jgi:hypothetical protein